MEEEKVTITKAEYDKLIAYNEAYQILYNALSKIEYITQNDILKAEKKVIVLTNKTLSK